MDLYPNSLWYHKFIWLYIYVSKFFILLSKQTMVVIMSNQKIIQPHIIILSEVSQTEKNKYHVISLIGGIYKNNTSELLYKIEVGS